MALKTQGTQLYFIDSEASTVEVITVNCATAINPGGSPADQIETTCLEDFDRSYTPGLRTPGTATATILADPSNTGHVRMFELSQANPPAELKWVIGFSDGSDAPTVDTAGNFNLPTTRSWFEFNGYIADFPFDFQTNTIIQTALSIQRSGVGRLTAKT